MNELKTLVVNGTEYTLTDDTKIPVPEACGVGQTVVVKAVDPEGRPTQWRAADLPRLQVLTGLYLEDEGYAILQHSGGPISSAELAVLMDDGPALVHFGQQYNPDVETVENYTMVSGSRDDSATLYCLCGGWSYEPTGRYVTYGGEEYELWGYA